MGVGFSRRDAAKWMLSASVGNALTAKVKASLAAASGAVIDVVRGKIKRATADGGAMGVAVAVVQGGRIAWSEGFGWANRDARLRVTPHTPFGMASLTKPFTTTTLMTLVEEGRLRLDGAANEALGKSKIFGTNGNAAAATVRMLGAHVSGLPGIYESYGDNERAVAPSPDGELERYGRLAYPPGLIYEYSNVGYAALHAIANAVTKMEFAELMQQRVLDPLGLRDSFFGANHKRALSAAIRYDPLGHAIPHTVTSTPASGELHASANDLARFLLFNMGHRLESKAGKSRGVLSERGLAELHSPVFTGPSGITSTFGWFRGKTASGVPFFFKTGGDPGVANRICFVPSLGLGCVAVTNQSKSAELAYAVCDDVMRSQLADWVQPREYCGFEPVPLADAGVFAGTWKGVLEDDGVRLPVRLEVRSPQDANIVLGANGVEAIREIRAEGEAFAGMMSGQIPSPDALRSGARRLQIKVIPHEGRLVGRVFADAGDPSVKNARLPYVVSLERA